MFFDEDYQNQLFAPFHAATKRNNVYPYLERRKDGRGQQIPKYEESYIKGSKKVRFQKLCDRAMRGEVWIADSCPEEFWKGNGVTTGALTQAHKWIPRRGGESNLKWDDHFDSWARACDSKLQKFAPQTTQNKPEKIFAYDPYGRKRNREREPGPTISRYI